jgi:hypothetical protein
VLGVIISRVLAGSTCSRLLRGDGITSPDLSIKGVPGVMESASIEMRLARKNSPAIGQAASIAKNLDEYQLRICSLVPSLPDSDPRKLQLQKYRVAAVAALASLAVILGKPDQASLEQWNAHARLLMEETSEAYLKAKSNSKLQATNHKKAFEFFGVPEEKIDAALAAFYG